MEKGNGDLSLLIKNFINEVEKNKDEEEPYYQFFTYDEGIDGEKIIANRKGLRMYAIELLKASVLESENYSFKNFWGNNNVEYNTTEIEILNKTKLEIEQYTERKETFKDKLFFGLLKFVLMLFLIILIVGIVTSVKWVCTQIEYW